MSRRLIALAAAATLTLAGCGGNGSGNGGTGGATGEGESDLAVVNAGKLTMCTHMSYPPFEFTDENGDVVGFDVDMARLVAEELGLDTDIEVVDTPFEQITSGVVFQAGQCDIALAGTTITDERANSVYFSDPYFDATQALMVPAGSDVTDLSDLQGRTLGVQTDTTGQIYAQQYADRDGYEMVVFDDLPTSLNAVMAGRVDAVINDNGVLFDFARQNPSTQVVNEFDTGEQYGMAAQKNDDKGTKIIDAANAAIADSKDDGRYDEIYQRWFGDTPSDSPTG
ncbi:MAG: transporter substrate-binding domain-containing protein [Mobilicoccus sp.]|nr:transporter substrate-binding domain-containing protein [Mobilicoccus sp.]